MTKADETAVLYNGSCPICSREIAHYEGYARKQSLPIRFDDLGGPELAQWGLSADDAARRKVEPPRLAHHLEFLAEGKPVPSGNEGVLQYDRE